MAQGRITSTEIADVIKKRHDNVKRTIERLEKKGIFPLPQTEEAKVTKSNGGKQSFQVYLCDKPTIERLANKGAFTFPPMEEKSSTGGRPMQVYLCDKRTSMIVVRRL